MANVQAAGGLVLTFSSQGLTVTNGISNITGLQLSNDADLVAETGAVVNLLGSTQVAANVRGPGMFESNGTLNLNFCRLRTGATLTNNSVATLSGTFMILGDGNTTFTNKSSFSVTGTGCQIRGEQSTFENEGTMTYLGSGTPFTLAPHYVQSGTVFVRTGTMLIESLTTNFVAGTVEISNGAVLKLGPSPYGGTQSHSFSGLCCIDDDGLLDIFSNYSIEADLNLDVGSGDPNTGTGGTRLQSTLDLGTASITNSGRFRFNGGTIGGSSGEFLNDIDGWAYTRGTGSGTLNANLQNLGGFQLGGGGLLVNAPFSNEGNFTIVAGSISGSGRIHNLGNFRMDATNPDNVTVVSCTFFNQPVRTVEVASGRLRFAGTVENISAPGLLSSGTWRAVFPGTLTFPSQVTTVAGDAVLAGEVHVMNRPGFTPEVGQQFTILTTTGTITGSFDDVISTNQYTYTLIHNINSVVLVVDSVNGIPPTPHESSTGLALSTPYPNPFNPQTHFRYSLPCAGAVRLSVLDTSGREVALLFEGWQPASGGSVTWDGRDRSGRRLDSGRVG